MAVFTTRRKKPSLHVKQRAITRRCFLFPPILLICRVGCAVTGNGDSSSPTPFADKNVNVTATMIDRVVLLIHRRTLESFFTSLGLREAARDLSFAVNCTRYAIHGHILGFNRQIIRTSRWSPVFISVEVLISGMLRDVATATFLPLHSVCSI